MCFGGGGTQASAPVNPAPYTVANSASQVSESTAAQTPTQAGQTPQPAVPAPAQPTETNDSFSGLVGTGAM